LHSFVVLKKRSIAKQLAYVMFHYWTRKLKPKKENSMNKNLTIPVYRFMTYARRGVCVLAVFLALAFGSVYAQTNNYIGPTNGDWATGTNWSGGVPTSAQDVTVIAGASNLQVRIQSATAAVAGNLTIGGNSASSVYSQVSLRAIAGTAASLNVAGNITMSPGTGASSLYLGTGYNGSNNTPTLTIGGGTNSILDGGGSGASEISIYGPMGTLGLKNVTVDGLNLNQSTPGSLTIGSGQTYTIGTTSLGSATAGVTEALTVNGTLVSNLLRTGASTNNGTNNATFTLNTGGLVKAQTIERTATQTTTFNWDGGTIQNKSGGNLTVRSTSAGNPLTISLAGTGTHTFEADSGRTITVDSTAVLADKSGENGTLTKAGAGTLTLNGANTHSGTTTVSAGTLALGHTNALQNSTLDTGVSGAQAVNFTVAGANTYTLGGLQGADGLAISSNTISVGANNASTAFSGAISGTNGRLVKTGTGTLTLNGSNTYTGNTTVSDGTLVVVRTNLTATITSNSIAVAFSNTPAASTPYTILTGPLAGGPYSTVTVSSPSGYSGTVDTNAGTVTVTSNAVTGPTFASTYPPGSENSVGSNGLQNLMNYALGGTGTDSTPALPVLTSDGTNLTLTANIRNDLQGVGVVGQYAYSLGGPWNDVTLTPTGATSTVTNTTVKAFSQAIESGQPRKFLRLKATATP
jgi:autotransporter-associated beta strand protein